jgi:3-phenylpropionate/trans-cinnamate dioxygenase ferredoxin subunit
MSDFELQKYNFYLVGDVDELPKGERLFIEVGDEPIVLFNIDGQLYAIADICTHDGGPLGDGKLEGCEVICPRHGARFDVRNGKVTRLPAVKNAPAYPVRVLDGKIEIGIARGE